MAASPLSGDGGSKHPKEHRVKEENYPAASSSNGETSNGTTVGPEDSKSANQPRGSSVADSSVSPSKGDSFRENLAKPNKVYVGGLPEHTRIDDLRKCFSTMGNIVNIELKVGYGFVEFDTREAADESVAKYNDGFFMGKQIRVEISRGGNRIRQTGEPGSCFKCGQMGHWARECPSSASTDSHRRSYNDAPLIDRIQKNYPPPRDYRDDLDPPGRLPPPPPSRDSRYYDHPPRDYRRPPSPSPRDYRDYPPPPSSRSRGCDDYWRGPPPDRDRYPPPPPPAPSDHRGSRYPPPDPSHRGYGSALPPPPLPPYPYDKYERRPTDRYGQPYQPPRGRSRTPPRLVREDYDRPVPLRDYPEYRGRPVSPPPSRYPLEYGRSPTQRYRRRSESPLSRYESYPPSNGYSGSDYGPPRGNPRDYPPPRNGRDADYRRP